MPFNFSWIIPEHVGGMARPRAEDTAWMRERGVTAVVSLTREPPAGLDEFELLHLPVIDMTSPTLDQLHGAVEFMREVVSKGGGVIVHCGAGMGRTGTVLAAYLVAEGLSAPEAIGSVRAIRPGSIETEEQELAVGHYAELVGGRSE